MSARDVVARAFLDSIGLADRSLAQGIDNADAILTALRAMPEADRLVFARELAGEGFAVVPVKLLRAARACMRETGWQLAPANIAHGSDGILELACAEVCEQVGELLTASQEPTR